MAGRTAAAERAGTAMDEEELRWEVFSLLLTTPRTPSSLLLPDGVAGRDEGH